MREFDVKYSPEEFLELADRLKPRLTPLRPLTMPTQVSLN